MRFKTLRVTEISGPLVSVIIDRGSSEFTSFPAEIGNPVYDSFLESQSLTDAEVQAMTPDVWHDMA